MLVNSLVSGQNLAEISFFFVGAPICFRGADHSGNIHHISAFFFDRVFELKKTNVALQVLPISK